MNMDRDTDGDTVTDMDMNMVFGHGHRLDIPIVKVQWFSVGEINQSGVGYLKKVYFAAGSD
jgi:hypothetical protein